MVKIFYVSYYNNVETPYVCYYKNDNYLYLVCTEYETSTPTHIRIKKSQYNQKIINDYEEYYTYIYGLDNTRIYEKIEY